MKLYSIKKKKSAPSIFQQLEVFSRLIEAQRRDIAARSAAGLLAELKPCQ